MSAPERGKRRTLVGTVSAAKMQKTVTVTVTRSEAHPSYGKIVRKRRKVLVHDEKSSCQPGDTVRIVETRRLSSRKRWRVQKVLKKGLSVPVLEGES